MIKRFRDEAMSASRLNHLNCVSIIDYGQSQDGLLYLAMEYVKGPTLTQLLVNENPLAIDRVIDIMMQMLGGIEEAHLAGVVHAESEERQHHPRPAARGRRRGQDRRLRHRAARHRRPRSRGPLDQRHARVHVARGDQRRAAVVRVGRLRRRHHPVRAARLQDAVLRRLHDGDPRESPEGDDPVAGVQARGGAQGARRDRRSLAREAPGGPVRVGRRHARGARRTGAQAQDAHGDGHLPGVRGAVRAIVQVLPRVRHAPRARQQGVRGAGGAGHRRGVPAAVHRPRRGARAPAPAHADAAR